MHQNSFIADKVGVKICNFKVIDKNCFIKFLNLRTSYICNSTIKKIYFVTFNKVSGGYPTFINNIEWVVSSCVYITTRSIQMQDLIYFMYINLCYFLESCFTCENVICPYLIADFNFINANLSIFRRNKGITRKAIIRKRKY